MKTFIEIRRELKSLIKQKTSTCTTEKENNKAINDARAEINKKYGKDWRGLEFNSATEKSQIPSYYDGHTNGEHWMD
jgi:hypothetical protein